MKITKYPQSAILLEYKNKRILIDPGSFCYSNNFTPDDWGKIDILLITHEHQDHFFPEAVKVIAKNNPNIKIITNKSVHDLLLQDEVQSQIILDREMIKIEDIEIMGIQSVHGAIPEVMPNPPEVIGFLIDNKFYHPGDTVDFPNKPKAEIVFVPFSGKVTLNTSEAVQFAREIGAKIAIPIHYDSPKYPVDPNDFVKEAGDLALYVKNGESVELPE